jgi:hypothetical protein
MMSISHDAAVDGGRSAGLIATQKVSQGHTRQAISKAIQQGSPRQHSIHMGKFYGPQRRFSKAFS